MTSLTIKNLDLYEVFWRNKHSKNVWSMTLHAPSFAEAESMANRVQEGNYIDGMFSQHEEIIKITKDYGVEEEELFNELDRVEDALRARGWKKDA